MFSCCRANPNSKEEKNTKKDKQKQSKQKSTSDESTPISDSNDQGTATNKELNELTYKIITAGKDKPKLIGGDCSSSNTISEVQQRNILPTIEERDSVDIVISNASSPKTPPEQQRTESLPSSIGTLENSIIENFANHNNNNNNNNNIYVYNNNNDINFYVDYEALPTPITDNDIYNDVNQDERSNTTKSPPPLNDSVSEHSVVLSSNDQLDNDERKYSNTSNVVIVHGSENMPKSCLTRQSSSSKSSIRKKVNINDSTEFITILEKQSSIDDDEVFSDSVPPKLPRANMCAPYIERRGSLPGCHGLPEWFNEERYNNTELFGGSHEPPITPVGKDELELKRQRLYSELLLAAQAAVDHRVRFYPNETADRINQDCDPDLKPSVAADLENLVNRLESLVERLERSISARELEVANKAFDSVKRQSFDLESANLPPVPSAETAQKSQLPKSNGLNQYRISQIENLLKLLNESYKNSIAEDNNGSEESLENIPTVLEEFLEEKLNKSNNMSVAGFQDILNGPFAQYCKLSQTLGGDIAKHAELVKKAFEAQLQYLNIAAQSAKPPQDKQNELLRPTSTQISAIQEFREKNRASPFFNHLSAISESIPALGWVCVSPTPGPHVKEMNDAGQFYTNRVLKDWKEKNVTHVEWARSWIQTLAELQQYIKANHTTGLVWSGKTQIGSGGPPPPPSAAGCPPPPPPPVLDFAAMDMNNDGSADDRSALFAEINKGEGITKSLKKVTADMQTHKNAALRTGPAPFKAPVTSNGKPIIAAKPIDKEPVFTRDGKKWLIEHQKSNPKLVVENVEMNNVVYMFKCENSTLTVKGKLNSVVMDSCKKCSLLFDSVVASIEFVNCQSVQMQVLGVVPTISIDKTDGCQMYLSKDSLNVEIVSSKSSEMNVLIPKDNGDFEEQPIPEQYKTTIQGKTLKTICVDSLG